MNDEKLLDEFLDGLKKGISGVEMGVLKPWGPMQLEPYFLDLWAKEIIEAFAKIQAKKINFAKIARSFPSNAVIRDTGYIVIGMKLLKLPRKERVKNTVFLLKILKERVKSDDMSFLKQNLVLDQNEVKEIIKRKNWRVPNEGEKINVGILAASLRNLMWSLYTDIFVNTGFENSGPYELGGGNQLITRDFFDLKPILIWPEVKKFPYDKIKIYTIYKNAKITIKMFNRVFGEKSLKDTLEKFAIEGAEINNIEKIYSEIITYTAEREKKFKELDFEEQKKLYIKIKHYALRNFFKLANMDWQATEEFYNRVRGKELIPSQDLKMKPAQVGEIYGRVFDPRDDFLPQL